jgi:hypothetical protein
MDIKKIIREEIEKLNEEIQSDLVLPKGKRIVLQADNPKVNRGLIVTWLEDGGYNVEYWYKDPSKIYPAEVVIDGKPITKDGKVVHLGYHPEIDEGFGSDEFLTKTEKKKFEKERLENAEVLGYTLTGTKDINEATKMRGARGLVKVPNEYVGKLGRVQYNLMKKLGYTRGGKHLIIADMHWGRNSRHRIKPNNQWSASILLKTHPYKMRRDNFGNFTGYVESDLLKGDVKKVLGELMRQLRANKLKLDGKPKFTGSTRHMPQIEFRVKPEQFNESINEASLTIPQYKTSIKKLSYSQQDKLFHFLHKKLKLMKLIDFINYRDGSLHIAKSSITPKIKKAIERKFKIKLKESINENRDFEKLYKLFSKKDYFGLKRQIKTQMGNYKRALKKGDKGAQRYSEKDVIDSVTRMVKDRAKRTYIELVKAIKKKDIRTLKSRLRHNQPYSIAIFNQVTGKKLPKTTRDIHSFLDNQFMKESVSAVNLDKEKNDERYPEQPNFNFDPEKGKTRIRKIRK